MTASHAHVRTWVLAAIAWALAAIGTGCTSTTGSGNGATASTADTAMTGDTGTTADTGTTVDTGTPVDTDTGTSAVDASSTCPPSLHDKTLGGHGSACTHDSDCSYGLCQRGGFLTGYDDGKGYCTKDCACSDPAAQCSADNSGGVEYLCAFELSPSGGNPNAGSPPQKRCARRCLQDAECAAANPALPHCISSSQYVSSAGVCGFDPSK